MSQEVEIIGKGKHGDDNRGTIDKPVKSGGVVMTANPAKNADGKISDMRVDQIGRQLITLYQVRELVATGRTALTRGQEGSVIGGIASTFLDLVEVSIANSSTQARTVDIRSATGGGIEDTIVAPAGGTVTKTYPVPLPDNEQATAWTAQDSSSADISDSSLTVSMRAIKNV